jgi:hypothetical protein
MAKVNPALNEIARVAKINVTTARLFCLQVQKASSAGRTPTFKEIAAAVRSLSLRDHPYTAQEVARLVHTRGLQKQGHKTDKGNLPNRVRARMILADIFSNSSFDRTILNARIADQITTRGDLDYLMEIARSLAILGLDIGKDHIWLRESNIEFIVQPFSFRRGVLNVYDLMHFCAVCWRDICSEKRHYQVPSQGRAEIVASAELYELITLDSVRFVREGVKAPGVYIQFKFTPPFAAIGIVKIQPDGTIVGFHKFINDAVFQGLIEAIALSYYRDLVVPRIEYFSQEKLTHAPSKTRTSKKQSRPKPLPRKRVIASITAKHSLAEWHEAQHRIRHPVVGHTRWIKHNYRANGEKRKEAEAAGVKLLPGFTWVREHKRGKQANDGLVLEGEDLATHTIFLPPSRASEELAELLGR